MTEATEMILPGSSDIALENDSVVEALEERNDEEVRRILREDF